MQEKTNNSPPNKSKRWEKQFNWPKYLIVVMKQNQV